MIGQVVGTQKRVHHEVVLHGRVTSKKTLISVGDTGMDRTMKCLTRKGGQLGPRRLASVQVVGSCIQFLLSGPAITIKYAGTYRKSSKEIAKKLKPHKKRGTVKDPRAIQVLEYRKLS